MAKARIAFGAGNRCFGLLRRWNIPAKARRRDGARGLFLPLRELAEGDARMVCWLRLVNPTGVRVEKYAPEATWTDPKPIFLGREIRGFGVLPDWGGRGGSNPRFRTTYAENVPYEITEPVDGLG
jgi:hypothetical protein